MAEQDFLLEQLKTIKNLCEVAELVIKTDNRHLLATILEELFLEAQGVTEENCVASG